MSDTSQLSYDENQYAQPRESAEPVIFDSGGNSIDESDELEQMQEFTQLAQVPESSDDHDDNLAGDRMSTGSSNNAVAEESVSMVDIRQNNDENDAESIADADADDVNEAKQSGNPGQAEMSCSSEELAGGKMIPDPNHNNRFIDISDMVDDNKQNDLNAVDAPKFKFNSKCLHCVHSGILHQIVTASREQYEDDDDQKTREKIENICKIAIDNYGTATKFGGRYRQHLDDFPVAIEFMFVVRQTHEH